MLSAPDSQSLTRLLISAGAFLLVAAFAVPGLILRDTGVLTVPRGELRRLTPTAEKEIERRQGIARDAGKAAPYLMVAFLLGGGALMAMGVPRLRRVEQGDEERRKMELDKLRVELRPQSAEEQRERLQEDLSEDEVGEPVAGGPEKPVAEEAEPVPGFKSSDEEKNRSLAQKGGQPYFPPALREAAEAERAVLQRLAEIAPPLYDLKTQVAVVGENRLLLDGLLLSEIQQLPDIVVEIKYSRGGNASLHNRISDAKQQLLRYLDRFGRNSVGWLIIVASEEPSAGRRRELEEAMAESADGLRLSILTLDQLDQLRLPI